jgi:5-methylcytosine-specific restriction endonuclease McrA
MALRALPHKLKAIRGIAAFAPKQADPFYLSKEWKALRLAVLRRDGFACVFCGARASIADHIVSRRAGGEDAMRNLRSLCPSCDNKRKERPDGSRRGPAA